MRRVVYLFSLTLFAVCIGADAETENSSSLLNKFFQDAEVQNFFPAYRTGETDVDQSDRELNETRKREYFLRAGLRNSASALPPRLPVVFPSDASDLVAKLNKIVSSLGETDEKLSKENAASLSIGSLRKVLAQEEINSEDPEKGPSLNISELSTLTEAIGRVSELQNGLLEGGINKRQYTRSAKPKEESPVSENLYPHHFGQGESSTHGN